MQMKKMVNCRPAALPPVKNAMRHGADAAVAIPRNDDDLVRSIAPRSKKHPKKSPRHDTCVIEAGSEGKNPTSAPRYEPRYKVHACVCFRARQPRSHGMKIASAT